MTTPISAAAGQPTRPGPVSTRTLGTLGMLGSPTMLAYGVTLVASGAANRNTALMGATGLLYLAGWMCSLVAMRQLGVMGRSAPSRVVYALQFALLVVASLFSVEELVYGSPARIPHPLLDLAWPLSHTFMLVTGAFVLKARAWTGWRRWPAFLVGFKIPLLAAAALALAGPGEPPTWLQTAAFTYGGTALMLLGYAVRTSDPAAARRPSGRVGGEY